MRCFIIQLTSGIWSRSNSLSSSERVFICPGCATHQGISPGLHFWFDNDQICEDQEFHALRSRGSESGTSCRQNIIDLDNRDRRIIGVFLAMSIIHLAGSPWLQQELDIDAISISPHREGREGYKSHYRPHIYCKLKQGSDSARPVIEYVSGLGVLILELATGKVAGWTDKDADYELEGKKSNRQRLTRILNDEKWDGNIDEDHRSIGDACLTFASMLAEFEHPDIDTDMAPLAVFYKHILCPLHKLLTHSFGITTSGLFPGLSQVVYTVPAQTHQPPAQVLAMFDNFDVKLSTPE